MTEDEKKLLIHRYQYYVLGESTIPDAVYDSLERKVLEDTPDSIVANSVGSSLRSSYSEDIIKEAEKYL